MTDSSPMPSSPETNVDAARLSLQRQFAEFRFQTVVAAISDYAVFMLDEHGCVATWNAGAERIKGYRADEIIGRHFSCLYPPEAVAAGKPADMLREAVEHGHVEDEGLRVRKDGSRFWARVAVTAIRDHDRQLRGFVKITRDMTERRRLAELEASTHRLSVFIATLAHELRNHLAPLRNSTSVLQSLPAPDPALAQCRDALDRQVGQLTRLVDDLLDVGRITAGKVELDEQPITVRNLILRAVESVQSKLDVRGQQINIDLPSEAAVLNGDEGRLVQVLHNLLDNASKFSARGASISISAWVEGRFVVIRVADHGAGISREALESVFEMFEQADNRLPGSDGFGLGLAICRTFVKLHGGMISAESDGPGRGATFTVRLPMPRHAAPAKQPTGIAATGATKCLRIVVVDDNHDSADTMGLLLKAKGHMPCVAYHARAALELAHEFRPHLMIIDLSMPDIDGFDLLASLRRDEGLAATTYVALSGNAQPSDHARTARAGFDAHLVKPLEPSELDAVLQRVAQRAQSIR